MRRLLYSFLLYLTYPLWYAWMKRRAAKRNDQPKWAERFGIYASVPKKQRPRAWFHAVSVGEVVAAKPIISQFRSLNPEYEIVLSTTTSSGRAMAEGLKCADVLIYFPVDLPHVCRRAMNQIQPDLVAILETELWFNFLHYSKVWGAHTALLNGRISNRSFASAKRARWFYKPVFALLDKCLMQTEIDSDRARYFGASPITVGNSKYDELLGSAQPGQWREKLHVSNDQPLVVVGSTRSEMEEQMVLDALCQVDIRTIYAPRHIERADEVVRAARKRNLSAEKYSDSKFDARMIVLDEYGLLPSVYPEATLAIIGGGFENFGGQNIIQPMGAGCPVICGPNMNNFYEPFQLGLAAGAIMQASNSDEIKAAISEVLSSEELRSRMSAQSRAIIEAHAGSAKRQAQLISSW